MSFKEDWHNDLKKLGACRSYAENADPTITFCEAYARCTDTFRIVWLLVRAGFRATAWKACHPWMAERVDLSRERFEQVVDTYEAAELLSIAVLACHYYAGYDELGVRLKSLVPCNVLLPGLRSEFALTNKGDR